jgi:outer membrane lipoprotein-sorting protein
MKKLLIAMCCITAIVLMSSCTTDSVEDIENQNSKTSDQISVSTTVDTTTEIDDKVHIKA